MLIKEPPARWRRLPRRRSLKTPLLVGAGLLLYTAGLVALACVMDDDIARRVRNLPGRALRAVRDAFTAGDARAGGDRLDIRIADGDLAIIRAERERALGAMFNNSDENAWVSADVSREGSSVAARVRLKGAMRDHWKHPDKWSLLIKVRGGETLGRMDRFSIQHPRTRGFVYEWLLQRALEEEGLLSLQFDLVQVRINGASRGVYALEEQPGKPLLERHGLREGPVIGFDKGDWIEYWKAHAAYVKLGQRNPVWFFRSAPVTPTQAGSVKPGTERERVHMEAVALLDAFRSGRLSASEVFEIDQIAVLAAIHAVLGAAELDWKDLSFYYNPLSGRLHPIGKELHHDRAVEAHRWWVNDGEPPHGAPFPSRLFADPEFERRYVAHLDRLSHPEWADGFLARYSGGLSRLLEILATEFPKFEFSDRELGAIGAVVRNTLHPVRVAIANFVEARGDRVELDVANLHAFGLRVLGARLSEIGMLPADGTPLLPGLSIRDVVTHQSVSLRLPAGVQWSDDLASELRLICRVPGIPGEFEAPVSRWLSSARIDLRSNDYRRLRPSVEREFLLVDEETREIRCLPGTWVVREPVVIPAGYRLVAGAGVEWDLRDGAFVLSHSPVQLIGSAERPVVFQSSDFSGGGLAVIDARGESTLEHFVARGLSAPVRGRWSLTGAVTFYESAVRIADATFADNRRGDDLVNLVRSDFNVVRAVFDKVAADAIDVDYSGGVLADSRFRGVGNDALDTSGSHVEVRRISIEDAGDKGMSFGEGSRADLSNVTISGARVGVASKDDSVVLIADSAISDSEYGLAAYRVKPEFGAGAIEARELRLSGNRASTLVERGARVMLNGDLCPDELEDVHGIVTR